MSGQPAVALGKGLQTLEGRVHFGQRPVGLRAMPVGVQGRHRPAPGRLQGLRRRAGAKAQAVQVIERVGGVGHGASG